MKLDADEKRLLASVERGEWKSAGDRKRETSRYAGYARTTLRQDRPPNIRLTSEAVATPAEPITPRLLNRASSGKVQKLGKATASAPLSDVCSSIEPIWMLSSNRENAVDGGHGRWALPRRARLRSAHGAKTHRTHARDTVRAGLV